MSCHCILYFKYPSTLVIHRPERLGEGWWLQEPRQDYNCSSRKGCLTRAVAFHRGPGPLPPLGPAAGQPGEQIPHLPLLLLSDLSWCLPLADPDREAGGQEVSTEVPTWLASQGPEQSGEGRRVDLGKQKASSAGSWRAHHTFSHLVGLGGGHIIKHINISVAKHTKIYTAWNKQRGNSPLSVRQCCQIKVSPLAPNPIRGISKELRPVPGKERYYGKCFPSHSPRRVPSALCVPAASPSPARDHHKLCWQPCLAHLRTFPGTQSQHRGGRRVGHP